MFKYYLPAPIVKMATFVKYAFLLLLSILSRYGESFTDSNQVYKLQWPGSHSELGDPEHLVVTTRNQEKYSCKYKASVDGMPNDDGGDGEVEDIDPVHLLEPLTHVCTRLLDVYWHYEFCYKRSLRQYHEEKLANQEVKLTEYVLGKFSDSDQKHVENGKTEIQFWFYNGISYPYYEVTIGGGALCDLTGQPRKSHLRFICHKGATFEFVHVSEMSSCEYLAVFATERLCRNPLYRVEEAPVQSIVCQPLEGSPDKPAMLRTIEEEVAERNKALSKSTASSSDAPSSDHVSVGVKMGKPPKPDENFVKSFLSGSKCLSGGQGWWKQEVCYGSHVKQFHLHTGGRTDILLGSWDRHTHELWYTKNKEKLDQQRKKGVVVHYYAKGDKCDVTGKHRDVQVRMKCVEGVSLSMSLQEPSTCKYLLTVESAYFCSLIASTDEYGVFVYDPEE